MELFAKYGLSPVINAAGTMTALGASRVGGSVVSAMTAILPEFVDMRELHQAAGRVIAAATGAEAGCLTASAAAGIAVAVAACMTGDDRYLAERLPDTAGLRNEVVVQKGHNVSFGANVSQMIRLTGASCIEAGMATSCAAYQLVGAINERTAAALYVVSHHTVQSGMLPLREFARIAKERGVPVIVDAASEYDMPRFLREGADLAIYSGHKFLGGPTSGILAGRADLIRACRVQDQGIARSMKIGKESIAGVMAALEQWQLRDAEAASCAENERIAYASGVLAGTQGLRVELSPDPTGNPIVRLKVIVDPAACGLTAAELAERLSAGTPRIFVRADETDLGYVQIDPCNLRDGEIEVVCERIRQLAAESGSVAHDEQEGSK